MYYSCQTILSQTQHFLLRSTLKSSRLHHRHQHHLFRLVLFTQKRTISFLFHPTKMSSFESESQAQQQQAAAVAAIDASPIAITTASSPLESENDSARSTTSIASSEEEAHRSHISVSGKLTDLQFLRQHPHHAAAMAALAEADEDEDKHHHGHGHHHPHQHHHHHHTQTHVHTHANDPHINYHDKPSHEPMTHSPTDDELTKVSEFLYGGRVVIPNKELFQEKLAMFKDLGIENLLVVSDFDFTISKFKMVDGSRGASCHRILEDCGLLSHDYHVEAQAIQRKYYPMEVDPNLDEESRIKYMIEWVEVAHALLTRSHLTKEVIHQAVYLAFEQKRFRLRDKVVDFFDLLRNEDVPLLIFSAGIADVLEDVLKRTLTDPEFEEYDITVISNRGIFNGPNGEISDFEPPTLHVFNKKASTFLETEFFLRPDVRARQNVLLLGDSLGDVTMAEGMEREEIHIMRIGFLNDRLERLPQYQEIYDVVILDDPGFDVAIQLVKEIAVESSIDALTTGATEESYDDRN